MPEKLQTGSLVSSRRSRNLSHAYALYRRGNDRSTGTDIEDVHVDEDVKPVYPGQDGLTVDFSAPVYSDSGELLGFWTNRAKFSLVEEIV